MRFVAVVACLVACRAPPPAPPAPRASEVRVAGETCLTSDVHPAIDRVLADHHADRSGLVVEVSAQPSGEGAEVALRVAGATGDVGLERRYTLAASDCASAAQLLALAVDRWLTSFPEWAEPPAPRAGAPERWLAAAGTTTVSAMTPPVGVEGALGGLIDFGGAADRFGATALVRTGIPQHAGEGRFREIALLGGAAWRHRFARIDGRIELRGGALRINGLGYLEDHASWIPWAEVAAVAAWRWSWGSIGAELAVTALRDHAVTRDGLVSQDIPLARLGLSGTFELLGR